MFPGFWACLRHILGHAKIPCHLCKLSALGSFPDDDKPDIRIDFMQFRKDTKDLHQVFLLRYPANVEQYPFTRLKGKKVNTLVFPNLTSARSSYKMLQMLDADVEIIGPIQMGLNKAIHFVDFGASVRDVVNIVAVATIDAYVDKLKSRITAAQQ